MKDKKTKNHKENWIGNIIRGFLLFMPLLAIGVTCAYAIFNKNAYQSYSDYYVQETNKVTNLSSGLTYIAYKNDNATTNGPKIYYTDISINWTDYGAPDHNYIAFYPYQNGSFLLYWETGDIGISGNFWNTNESFSFTPRNNVSTNDTTSLTYYLNTYEKGKISDVFYYSIDKVQQSPLFNWSTNTGMYNVIHGACTTLGIESTFVPFLLAYWLLTYLIYIIYDIALLIVNMAHNRIHDVESSI